MKQHLQKVGLFFAIVFIAYLLFFDYSAALKRRLPLIQEEAKLQGITFALDDLSLKSPTRVSISNLEAVVESELGEIPFKIETGEFQASLLSLFMFNAVFDATFDAYGGTITVNWANNLISREATLAISASQLDLLNHPSSFAAGLTGKLNFEATFKLTGTQLSGFVVHEGDIHLELVNAHYNGGHSIIRSVQSPEIKDLTVNIYAKLFQQRIGINSLDIFSSLGRASGSGFVHLKSRNQVERGRIELNARLTPEGATLIGGFFALAAGEPIENPGRNWKFLATKNKNSAWTREVRPQL